MPSPDDKDCEARSLCFGIYLLLILGSFLFYPEALSVLGLPWSVGVVMLGMLIIHAGSGNALEWALLLSTVSNIILFVRSILLGYINESIVVEESE